MGTRQGGRDDDYCDRWYGSIWRGYGCCVSRCTSAGETGGASSDYDDCRGRQRNNLSDGARGRATDRSAGAAAAQRRAVCATDCQAAGNYAGRSTKLFGKIRGNVEITVSAARKLI